MCSIYPLTKYGKKKKIIKYKIEWGYDCVYLGVHDAFKECVERVIVAELLNKSLNIH